MILEPGEKIYVIERRYFEYDFRRHFVGEVIACDGSLIRAKGFSFLLRTIDVTYIKNQNTKERILSMDQRISVYVIPRGTNLDSLHHEEENRKHYITDGGNFRLDITEFYLD